MLFSARTVPNFAPIELRSLRRSLNTPVVDIAELPVGPASAAMALHGRLGGGDSALTVAVRCQRTGGVVFFSAREAPSNPLLLAAAALSFAEGMGFLFDEDVLGDPLADRGAARAEAERIWTQFGSTDPLDAASVGAASAPARESTGEHTEVAEPGAVLSLTKFRRVAAAVDARPSGPRVATQHRRAPG